MKRLYLTDILKKIGGTIIQGSGNPPIHHVTKNLRDKRWTLFFHLNQKQLDERFFRGKTSMVIVTDKPQMCSRFRDHVILVKVKNCNSAYWKFVDYYRNLFQIPVYRRVRHGHR